MVIHEYIYFVPFFILNTLYTLNTLLLYNDKGMAWRHYSRQAHIFLFSSSSVF